MPTAIYIRVSSPKGQKIDSQRAELEAWLKRQRIKGARWFEDRDSATNSDPLNRALRAEATV
jgi:DNA invertase Pin-like site-specific DNA recombinase